MPDDREKLKLIKDMEILLTNFSKLPFQMDFPFGNLLESQSYWFGSFELFVSFFFYLFNDVHQNEIHSGHCTYTL